MDFLSHTGSYLPKTFFTQYRRHQYFQDTNQLHKLNVHRNTWGFCKNADVEFCRFGVGLETAFLAILK